MLIDTKQAAEILGVSPSFLERDRWAGPTIPFVRVGSGKGVIRYDTAELGKYITARTVAAQR